MRVSVSSRDDAVMLNDEGMEDCIVIGSIVFNRDGSITASCGIMVRHPDGRKWETYRDIRLPLRRDGD
jgi:hypothetical protein